MAKNIRWQIPFVSLQGIHYRVDIYDEGEFTPVQLTAGPTPFVTNEDASDDFFAPVRTQTGTLQVCTDIEGSNTPLKLEDILPANNIARPVRLLNLDTSPATIEWQGFLSCEAYSQDYTGIPQILDIPINSVLETLKSYKMPWNRVNIIGGNTIETFIYDLLLKFYNSTEVQVTTQYSGASSDILSKYIFQSQYISYEEDEASGTFSYIYNATSVHDILEDICKFMGWCLREVGDTFYFTRIGSDEIGTTAVDMSTLQWKGTGHQRTVMQGAKKVSVEAKVEGFKTYFEMPKCPLTGLNTKNRYPTITAGWYYDKCTQTTVGMFTSHAIAKCFMSRFYGIVNDSVFPWDVIYRDLGFNNAIYLNKYTDSYSKVCTIVSVLNFNVICGRMDSAEDVGHFVLKIKDETAAFFSTSGSIRCGLKFAGRYYTKNGSTYLWTTNSAGTFEVPMSNGSGEIEIEMPRLRSDYTIVSSNLELYIYDDFDNGKDTAVLSEISIDYVPPYRKNTDNETSNRYAQGLSGYRDEIDVSLNLASSFGNVNALSHVYGIKVYRYGSDSTNYLEPITALTYTKPDTTTESRRPEVDLLNRLAAYYGAARQRLELEVAHPTAAPLPLLKLNGINDVKVYLPLSESRDWQTDVCKLTCFETPQ